MLDEEYKTVKYIFSKCFSFSYYFISWVQIFFTAYYCRRISVYILCSRRKRDLYAHLREQIETTQHILIKLFK